jgi:4-hydroxymandelate oxidase
MNRKRFLATVGAGALAATHAAGATVSPTMPNTPPATGPAALPGLLDLDDVERLAATVMAPGALAYIAGGAADEQTLRWNRERYQTIALRQRILRDVEIPDCATTLFGQRLNFPIILAPTGVLKLVHPEGELATVRGANLAGAVMCLSSGSNTAIEEVAAAATQPLWFQLYVAKDRGLAKALIQRVEAAGVKALEVTVDGAIDGARNRQHRTPYVLPPGVGFPHYVGITEPPTEQTLDRVRAQVLLWKDIEWIRGLTQMKIMLKGVLDADDAAQAVGLGVDGIIVSNHGGRCLDTLPATIEALPAIADRVGRRVPVLVDGGIRRGTDVVKALALGAAAVQIGRPHVYGLAVAGAEGVAHVVRILRQELLMAMALMGCRTLSDITRDSLWPPSTRSNSS